MSTEHIIILAIGTLFILDAQFRRSPVPKVFRWILGIGIVLSVVNVVWDLILGNYVNALLNFYLGFGYFYLLWRDPNRRNRDKVSKLIGAKARAVRDKLVAAMPQAKPSALPQPA